MDRTLLQMGSGKPENRHKRDEQVDHMFTFPRLFVSFPPSAFGGLGPLGWQVLGGSAQALRPRVRQDHRRLVGRQG